MSGLTHLDEQGRARMVDVGDKPVTARRAVAQQLDRVGTAVDDALEERLAVLIGRQRALRPRARLVQQQGEPRIRFAELLGDLALDPLGECG